MSRKSVIGLIRTPVVQFLVLGVLLGVVLHWVAGARQEKDDTTIRVSAADVARLEAGWRARWNRPPTAQELQVLIDAQVRETALHREALALGLDRDDPVVRRVLVQKLERIAQDLVEMSLSPTDLDLQQYHAEHADRYQPPPVITFSHVFVDPDRRGDRTLEDAESILERLQARGAPDGDEAEFGDPFMLQRYYPQKDEARIASLFGQGFAEAVFVLEPGRWHGPVLSGYGPHLVYVDTITEFPAPVLDDVRDRVTQEWVDDRRREITEQYFADLLAKYDVVIESRTVVTP